MQLEIAIAQCFNLSMDGRVPETERNQYMAKAMLLRQRFAVLNAMDFGDADEDVQSANHQLVEVHNRLAGVKAGLGNSAASMAALAELAGVLDALATRVELAHESRPPSSCGETHGTFDR